MLTGVYTGDRTEVKLTLALKTRAGGCGSPCLYKRLFSCLI